MSAVGKRQRQRLHQPARDVVLQPEQIAERRLNGVRRQNGSARRLDQLGDHAQLIAGPQDRAGHDPIDIRFRCERLEVRRLPGELRGLRAGPDDERADAGQRRRDRVRQAEGQKIRFLVGTQRSERQNHQARERMRDRGRCGPVGHPRRAQLVGHLIGRREPLGRFLRERVPQHAIDRRDRRHAGQRRRVLVDASRARSRRSCGR